MYSASLSPRWPPSWRPPLVEVQKSHFSHILVEKPKITLFVMYIIFYLFSQSRRLYMLVGQEKPHRSRAPWGWGRRKSQTWPWRWRGSSPWPAPPCRSWGRWPPEARSLLHRCPLQTAPSASAGTEQKGPDILESLLTRSERKREERSVLLWKANLDCYCLPFFFLPQSHCCIKTPPSAVRHRSTSFCH